MFRSFGEGCEDVEDVPSVEEPSIIEIWKRRPSLYKVSKRRWRFQDVDDVIFMEFAETKHATSLGCEDNINATFRKL